MAELVFTAGENNSFNVSEDGIQVEFNAGNQAEFNAMVLNLGHTIMDLQLGCGQQAGEFFRTLPANDELWTADGKWAGVPFEKRYLI